MEIVFLTFLSVFLIIISFTVLWFVVCPAIDRRLFKKPVDTTITIKNCTFSPTGLHNVPAAKPIPEKEVIPVERPQEFTGIRAIRF